MKQFDKTRTCLTNAGLHVHHIKLSIILVVALTLLGNANNAWGQCEFAKLLPDDLIGNSQIGRVVDISGDIAVIGHSYDYDNGSHAGAAYVYHFDGSSWTLQQKLLAPDGEAMDSFGVQVGVGEAMIAIGASGDDDFGENSGAVYVFEFDNNSWVLHSKLHPDDIGPGHGFAAVAISGDTLLIGAAGDNIHGIYSGSAYIFRFNGSQWLQEDKLIPEIGHPGDYFGARVSIHGDVALIGSWGDDTNGQESGSANVFRFNPKTSKWEEEQRFEPNGSGTYQLFANTLAIWGDNILIGARGDDEAWFSAGATYAYHYDGSDWSLAEKILPPSDGLHLGFGWSVTMSADTAVIGLTWLPSSAGAAEVYRLVESSWEPYQILIPSDGKGADQFGIAVALSGSTAIIGSRLNDEGANDGGSAYIFNIDQLFEDCNGNLVNDLCELAVDLTLDINDNSIPDACDADLSGDGSVSTIDLLLLFANWGPCDDCDNCVADFFSDCAVEPLDLLFLLNNWG